MEILDIGIGKIGVTDGGDEQLPRMGIDALLVPQFMSREVSLEREIEGSSGFASAAAVLSKACDYPILCGCITRFEGVRHLSVLTFAGGKLADVADRALGSGDYYDGDTLKVLRLRHFDLGVLVDTDIFRLGAWKKICPHCQAVAGVGFGSDEYKYLSQIAGSFGMPYAAAFSDGVKAWSK